MHKNIIISLLLMVASLSVKAQREPHLVFHNIPLKQSSQVFCSAQDVEGVLWLGTDAGFYSFDGYRFIPHSPAMENKTIFSILLMNDYVLTGGIQGLAIYNRKTGTYVDYHGSRPRDVRALIRQGDHVLIGSSQGLFFYNCTSATVRLLSPVPKNILSLAVSRRGILIGCLHGLYQYASGHCAPVPITVDRQQPAVSCIQMADGRNQFWIGTYSHLLRYDALSGKIVEEQNVGNIVVKSMDSQNGRLMIGSDDGLYLYQNKKVRHLMHDSKDPFSLGNNIVWSILHDRSGNTYLGTDDGLSVVPRTNTISYYSVSSLTGSSAGNSLSHLFEDSFGCRWIGGSSGLIRLDPTVAWFRQNDRQYPISHNRIRKIFEDSERNLLISTDIGISLYERESGRMHTLMLKDRGRGVEVPWVYDILECPAGMLWMATFDDGIYIVDREKMISSGYYYTADMHLTKGLNDRSVRCLALGRDNKVWALTDKGLDVIDATTMDISNVADRQTFDRIVADRKGDVWAVNTRELCRFSSASEPPIHIRFNENLQVEHIVSLLEVNGDIWIVTPSTCAIYGAKGWKSSLQIPYIQARCAYYHEKEDKVIVGGKDGMAAISAYPRKRNQGIQRIMLSDLFVNGKRYETEGTSLTLVHALRLNDDENDLDIVLTDLPLQNHTDGLYAYRLDGLEDSWHLMEGLDGRITYNGLPHGDYHLEVYTVKGFGELDRQVYSLAVDILPPWYLTIWAKSVYAAIVAALMVWAFNFYQIRHRLKMEREERRRILRDSDARMRFYNNLSRRLHTGLDHIMYHLVGLSGNPPGRQQAADLEGLQHESTQLNAYIRQAFDMGDLSLQTEESSSVRKIDVVAYCASLMKGRQEDLKRRGVAQEFSADGNVVYEANVIEWDSVVYNILQYMTEFSEEGARLKMVVSRHPEQSAFTLSVASDRFRITEEQLPYIFQRYTDVMGMEMTNIYLAHEMYFVKNYVELHHGVVEVAKREGGKVMLTVELPLSGGMMAASEKVRAIGKPASMDLNEEKLLREITAAIEDNLADSDFNVSKLQEIVGVGSKLLYRKTKQTMGLSPVEYIRQIRMKRAAMLLSQGKFSVSEVMYAVGFSNSGYFSKCFQNAFGVTPTRYAQEGDCHETV